MITGFEELTYDLTKYEKKILPILLNWFKKMKKKKPVLDRDIAKRVNGLRGRYKPELPFTGVRLRKLKNFIRSNSILPVIAMSKGNFVSYDRNDIISEITSLKERAHRIRRAAAGLEKLIGVKEPVKIKYKRKKVVKIKGLKNKRVAKIKKRPKKKK